MPANPATMAKPCTPKAAHPAASAMHAEQAVNADSPLPAGMPVAAVMPETAPEPGTGDLVASRQVQPTMSVVFSWLRVPEAGSWAGTTNVGAARVISMQIRSDADCGTDANS